MLIRIKTTGKLRKCRKLRIGEKRQLGDVYITGYPVMSGWETEIQTGTLTAVYRPIRGTAIPLVLILARIQWRNPEMTMTEYKEKIGQDNRNLDMVSVRAIIRAYKQRIKE